MKIQMTAALKPLSHLPGTVCVIPLTTVQVQVFPMLLKFLDLVTGETWIEKLQWEGPIEGFTVQLDLDKRCVVVFGQGTQQFCRLWIKAVPQGIQIRWDKEKKERVIALGKMQEGVAVEKLSLGKHTLLDWCKVSRHMSVEEIAPVLFQLGQMTPTYTAKTPILNLLHFEQKQAVVPQLRLFLKAGFEGILSPRLQDEKFQGIVQEEEVTGSSLALLTQGYLALRSLFFQEHSHQYVFLPQLPPEFHAGRITYLQTSLGDLIGLEWSKKLLKRVVIKPAVTHTSFLLLQKPIRAYRVNRGAVQAVEKPLSLEAGVPIFLDRFEK